MDDDTIYEDKTAYQLPKEVVSLANPQRHNIAGGKDSNSPKVSIKGGINGSLS